MQRVEVIEWKYVKNGNYARLFQVLTWFMFYKNDSFSANSTSFPTFFEKVINVLRQACFKYDFCKKTHNLDQYCNSYRIIPGLLTICTANRLNPVTPSTVVFLSNLHEKLRHWEILGVSGLVHEMKYKWNIYKLTSNLWTLPIVISSNKSSMVFMLQLFCLFALRRASISCGVFPCAASFFNFRSARMSFAFLGGGLLTASAAVHLSRLNVTGVLLISLQFLKTSLFSTLLHEATSEDLSSFEISTFFSTMSLSTAITLISEGSISALPDKSS